MRGFVLRIFCLFEKQETQITSNQTAGSSVYTVNHLVSEETAMKKAICWMIAVLFLLTLGCSNKEAEAMQQGDMFDALANGNIQSAANNETTSVQQRSHTVTVDGETVPWCFCLYDVLPDGTVRLDSLEDGRSLGWMIPEAIDGYVVSTLGRNMLTEALPVSAQITIPDCVTKLEGNPFDCLGLSGSTVSKIIVSQTHPTLEVIDGVLFSKPDKRLVCACGRIGSEEYSIPEGTLTIEDHAFYNANIPNGTIHIPDSVTTIGKNPFSLCNKSSDLGNLIIRVSANHPVLEIVDNVLFSKPDHRLICLADRRADMVQYSVPVGTEIIDDLAFYRGGRQESITIPASVKTMGINPFCFMLQLKEVDLDSSGTAFEMADGLLYDVAEKKLISCPAQVTWDIAIQEGTRTIGPCAFAYKISGKDNPHPWHVTVPSSVTEVGDYAFYGNSGMTTDVPPTLRTIGICAYAFCPRMDNELVFGGGVKIKAGAFSGLTGTDGPGITGLTIVGEGGAIIGFEAFYGCKSFTKLYLTEGESYVGGAAFQQSDLQEVSFAEGLLALGWGSFWECHGLRGSKLVLPTSLEYIGDISNDSGSVLNKEIDRYVTTNICTMNVFVTEGSYAEQYCKENGISYQYSK